MTYDMINRFIQVVLGLSAYSYRNIYLDASTLALEKVKYIELALVFVSWEL